MYPGAEDLTELATETGDDQLVADGQKHWDAVVALGVKLIQYTESRHTLEEIATVIEKEAKIVRGSAKQLETQIRALGLKLHAEMQSSVADWQLRQVEEEQRLNRMNELSKRLNLQPITDKPGYDKLGEDFEKSVYEARKRPLDQIIRNGKSYLRQFRFRRLKRLILTRSWDIFWGLVVFTLLLGWATDAIRFWYWGAVLLSGIYILQTSLLEPKLSTYLFHRDIEDIKKSLIDLFELQIAVRRSRAILKRRLEDGKWKTETAAATASNPGLPSGGSKVHQK